MTLNPLTALGTAGLISLPALALAASSVGDVVGTSEADIRANLESQGYIVQEIEFEDGEIEVEALLDGQEVELELSRNTGAVIEIEAEDEDDDD